MKNLQSSLYDQVMDKYYNKLNISLGIPGYGKEPVEQKVIDQLQMQDIFETVVEFLEPNISVRTTMDVYFLRHLNRHREKWLGHYFIQDTE